jgi:hypothetical protein
MTAIAEEPGQIEVPRAPGDLMMRLVEVASEMSAIPKAGYNQAQHYSFASAEDLIGAIRSKLLERNVLVLAYEHHTDERLRTTSQGGESAVTTVHLVFLLVAADTGERIELMWPGRGEDPMDKGIGKALTNAIKTFLRQQFLLPWGDDPEADESSDARAGQGEFTNLAGLVSGSGLTDAKLNEILVGAGLAAQQKPFSAFMRIPNAKADVVAKLVNGALGNA